MVVVNKGPRRDDSGGKIKIMQCQKRFLGVLECGFQVEIAALLRKKGWREEVKE